MNHNNSSGQNKECDYLKLSSIQSRCKRYDANNDGSNSSKVKTSSMPCTTHGNVKIEECIFKLESAKRFISFVCFLIQFKFKLLNIEDIN